MSAMLSTYNRLGLHVLASNVAVIKAGHKLISVDKRKDPASRAKLKQFYCRLLETHAEAAILYFQQFRR